MSNKQYTDDFRAEAVKQRTPTPLDCGRPRRKNRDPPSVPCSP